MMVSSKFSRRPRPLWVPPVCRKITPPGGTAPPPNPNPAPTLNFWYHIDCTWYIYHYTADGTIQVHQVTATKWESALPKPQNGEWGTFLWDAVNWKFHSYIFHYEGGVLKWTTSNNWTAAPHYDDFDTDTFTFTNPTYWTCPTGRLGRNWNP